MKAKTGALNNAEVDLLRSLDVFSPRAFWTLPLFKRDGLALAQFVETHVRTR